MVISLYSIVFLIAAIFCFVLSYYSWLRKKVIGAFELSLLLFSAGIWVFFVFFESAATSVEAKIFWSKVSYIGVVTTPVLYFLFVMRFTGHETFIKYKQYLLLFLLPAITLGLAYTNEFHHLIWKGFSPISDSTNIMAYYHGFWFWIGYLIYSYVLLLICSFQLILFIRKYKNGFMYNGWLVVVAGMFPWIASICYIFDINPVPGFDLTPFLFVFSGFLFAVGFLRSKLINLAPVAREALLETLPDGMIALDEFDRIQDINENAIRILGIENKRYLGLEISVAVNIKTKFLDAIVSSENLIQIPVGEEPNISYFRIIKQSLKNYHKIRLIIIRDVTEHITHQKKILAAEKKYQRMYHIFRLMSDNIPDMIWAKDLEKNFIFVNKALTDSLLKAKDTDEPIGKSLSYFFERQKAKDPENPDRYTYPTRGEITDDIILNTRESTRFDEEIYIDGFLQNHDFRKSPLLDENDNMIGIVGSARDITAQKEIEKKLIESKLKAEENDRQKSSFLANMSHEIRTPMNSILGFLSFFDDESLTKDERKQYLGIIKSSGERLLSTINDIIDISKIETGNISINLSEFDINDLISYMYSFFSQEAELKDISLIKSEFIDYPKSIIMTDKEKMYSIAINLIKNAVKYTSKGFVEYGASVDDEYFNFFVKDSGFGISKEKIIGIFDRFNQGDLSKDHKYESSGLGLSITRAYCELLGGKVWCESEVNVGSTFFVQLPLKEYKETDFELINLRE